jgi:hypothetical protein
MRFKPDADYVIAGETMAALYKATERLNDGMTLTPDERRGLAQRMQVLLWQAAEIGFSQ